MIALRIVRSPVGAILTAIRENPLRAAAVGHNVQAYKLTAFVIAAAYAGFAGGLLGVLQGFMPPDAFMFDTSGQLIMQTAIGGRGTLFGPLVGAGVWLFLQDFLQATLKLGAAWKLVLGLVFVLLVCFLRQGIIGGIKDLIALASGKGKAAPSPSRKPAGAAMSTAPIAPMARAPRRRRPISRARCCRPRASPSAMAASSPTRTSTSPCSRASCAASSARTAPARSTFFKMLTCEVPPTSGSIVFEGHDITGMSVTDVCQLGLTKSYQVNQLFNKLTVRENLTIAALAELRGKFKLDLFARHLEDPRPRGTGGAHAAAGEPHRAHRHAGVAAGLRREAPARDRPGPRLVAQPAAARRAAGRHEPARAGRDRAAARSRSRRAAR